MEFGYGTDPVCPIQDGVDVLARLLLGFGQTVNLSVELIDLPIGLGLGSGKSGNLLVGLSLGNGESGNLLVGLGLGSGKSGNLPIGLSLCFGQNLDLSVEPIDPFTDFA